MNHSVLARKWRPKSLQEMVGQEHILTIITNSISQQRLHHAYLFSGTRGVGKTTLARIFTKCLNCETGPTASPCNNCAACIQIDKGIYPDLIEIDAASRTKVEDTRELLDNVQYAPTSGKYKVYLIDEVHMLSGHSFNALLKTLEEPPEHVKFLLATTDPQKLPITVLSRCLKLTLKMLTIAQISAHLEKILTLENISFETSALVEIAQAAQGSMRDALSILDQAIVFCNHHISFDLVCHLLGTETKQANIALLQAVTNKEEETIFALINSIEEQGGDFLRVTDDLLHLLHHVALYQKNPRLISLDDARLCEATPDLSKKLSPNDVQLLYQILLTGKRDLPFAPTVKIGFEILILRALDFYPLDIAVTSSQDQTKATPPSAIAHISTARTNIKPTAENNHMNSRQPDITHAPHPHKPASSPATIHTTNNGKVTNDRLDLNLAKRYQTLQQKKEAEKQESVTNLKEDANLAQLLEMFDADIQETSIDNKGK